MLLAMTMGLYENLLPHLPRMGITRVANVTGLDHVGIPVVMVTRPNSRSISVSQGKGLTLHNAKISGVMESIEQFQAEHINQPLTLASYFERTHAAKVVNVFSLPRGLRQIDEHSRILWITARRIRKREEQVEVPFEMVHLDLTEPLPAGSGFFALGSNGLASGANFASAANHALWEVVERDALALFYARSPREQGARRVRLDTVDDSACRMLIDRYRNAEVGVAVWDMTSDLGIPAFLCSIGESEVDELRRIGTARGYGCHPDSASALCRALTEAAQSRLTRIVGSRDDIQPESMEAIRSFDSIRMQLVHLDHESQASRSFREIESTAIETPEEALDWTCQRLEDFGFGDISYVDLSPPGVPVAVVRVIVVGLEGFPESPGYVPGARARTVKHAHGRRASRGRA